MDIQNYFRFSLSPRLSATLKMFSHGCSPWCYPETNRPHPSDSSSFSLFLPLFPGITGCHPSNAPQANPAASLKFPLCATACCKYPCPTKNEYIWISTLRALECSPVSSFPFQESTRKWAFQRKPKMLSPVFLYPIENILRYTPWYVWSSCVPSAGEVLINQKISTAGLWHSQIF